ncbi:MAG TPA: hypothetical protein VGH27_09050 [Streptosporangiaceae bacterium]
MADLKITQARGENAASTAPRGGTLGRLRGPGWDRESLHRLGRSVRANATPGALWRRHRLFSLLVLLSIIPRVLATLAFRPAELIPDSFSYMQEGANLSLGQVRPAGYPILLRILEPFHSLVLITTLQHLMGIAIAVIVYGVLRTKGLPGWGASLATVPTLFDPRQIWLESSILPDTLFGLAVLIAVVLLITERVPKIWQCTLAGLLMAYASILRGNGAPVIVAILVFMLVRRVGWRAFVAGTAAMALPLLAYVGLFRADYGQLDLTNSTGLFLWSRTMSFANCAIIKPPPDLRPLCPDAQPFHGPAHAKPWSVGAVLNARPPADYLWTNNVWWRHDKDPGVNAYNNKLAEQFALDAIKAQPLSYARVVSRDVMLTFVSTDRPLTILGLNFTTAPDISPLSAQDKQYEYAYAHTARNTHAVQPYAYFMFFYQLPVYFPGWVFFLVVVAGFAGIVRSWRRRRKPGAGTVPWAMIALPWVTAAITIVVAPALHEYLYRYAISAVPVACIAAGLAFARRRPDHAQAAIPAQETIADGVPPQDDASAPADPAEGQTPSTASPQTGGVPAAGHDAPAASTSAADPLPAADPAPEAGVEGGHAGAPDFEADTDPGWGPPITA